jgi:hypothetical protein
VRCAVGLPHARRGFLDGVPDSPPRRGPGDVSEVAARARLLRLQSMVCHHQR